MIGAMKWDSDGGRVVTTMFEAAAFRRGVQVKCACGHTAVLNPYRLWWHFHSKHLDDELSATMRCFYCTKCRRRGHVSIYLTNGEWTDNAPALPLPPEPEWKRAVARFRC